MFVRTKHFVYQISVNRNEFMVKTVEGDYYTDRRDHISVGTQFAGSKLYLKIGGALSLSGKDGTFKTSRVLEISKTRPKFK